MCGKHEVTQAGNDNPEDVDADASEGQSKRRRLLMGAGAATAAGGLAGCAELIEDVLDEEPDLADEWHRDHDWEADPDAALDWDNYDVIQLGDDIDSLMSIDVAPDGKVWYINRGAPFVTHGDDTCQVGYVDPETGEHEVALELDVIVGAEHLDDEGGDPGDSGNARELGGQGVAVCPENEYVYVYYHPASDDMEFVDNPYNEDILTGLQRVSRFDLDDGEVDPDSETEIINIPFQLNTCCHYGGYLEFGPQGYLWISTGDDANNVGNPDDEINWFMGDERDGSVHGRPAAVSDAQRTSGNAADLRGSILRIKPEEDGGYTVPEDNLFPLEEYEDEIVEGKVRPEIHSMGFRNPYVISIDEHTGALWVSDYANDGTSWEEDMGPMGIATHHLVDEPINAGWPFCKGYYPYRYRDYELEEPGQPFWVDNLRNRSPNNTGVEDIPEFTPATLWHGNNWDAYVEAADWVDMPNPGEVTWPELPASGSANAGPAYRYSEDYGEGALDPYYEGRQFFITPYAGGGYIGSVGFNEDGSVDIQEFLPDHDFVAPTDMEVLPDGRVVVMDYGGPWDGSDGGIFVVEYNA